MTPSAFLNKTLAKKQKFLVFRPNVHFSHSTYLSISHKNWKKIGMEIWDDFQGLTIPLRLFVQLFQSFIFIFFPGFIFWVSRRPANMSGWRKMCATQRALLKCCAKKIKIFKYYSSKNWENITKKYFFWLL